MPGLVIAIAEKVPVNESKVKTKPKKVVKKKTKADKILDAGYGVFGSKANQRKAYRAERKKAEVKERLSKAKPVDKTKLAKIRKEPGKSNAGKYPNVKKFAGPDGTYPINTLKRAKSALKLAYHAKDPAAIKKNVLKAYPSLKEDRTA